MPKFKPFFGIELTLESIGLGFYINFIWDELYSINIAILMFDIQMGFVNENNLEEVNDVDIL